MADEEHILLQVPDGVALRLREAFKTMEPVPPPNKGDRGRDPVDNSLGVSLEFSAGEAPAPALYLS